MEKTRMESKERDVLLIIILVALLFIVFDCLTGKAGSLEPDGPPQPTMVTLDYISTQINGISSPVNKVVRGVITFESEEQGIEIDDLSAAVDPNRSVVLLSNAVACEHPTLTSKEWLARTGACLLGLTDDKITIQVEPHPADQIVSYQIIEYK